MKALILSIFILIGATSFASTAELVVETPAQAATPSVAEADIPLATTESAIKAVEPSSSSKVLLGAGLLLGFAALGFLAIKKYKYRDVKTQQFQMKIISQFHLSPRKSLAVVQVAGESILLGVTDHNISMIKSLSLLDEDFNGDVPQSFNSVFNEGKTTAKVESDSETDVYSIQKIQDVVSSKIKNLRTL